MDDEVMPRWSPGIRSTPFVDGLLVHDPIRHEVHVLNATGALVWEACDGATEVAALVQELAAATDHPWPDIELEVLAHLEQLSAAGLVDRPHLEDPVGPVEVTPIEEPLALRSLLVLDDAVEVRADDPRVLDRVRAIFGDLHGDRPPTAAVGLERVGEAGIRIHGRGLDRLVETDDELDEALASWLNRVVAPSTSVLALHAGAVRSPDGQVVVVVGASGAGKSTLTAALVQAGWDYLTDEATGVRADTLDAVGYPKPLALDQTSRSLLGITSWSGDTVPVTHVRSDAVAVRGDAGRVAAVVVPVRSPGEPLSVTTLDAATAVVAMAPNAINLGPAGQAGLDALAALAERSTCVELVYDELVSAVVAVAALAGQSPPLASPPMR